MHVMHKIFFFIPVLVNWVSYFFPPNFISRLSTHFTELAVLGLVFVFSWSLVSIYLAYIFLSCWFIFSSSYWYSSTSSVFLCLHSQLIFLHRHFWWWRLLGQFGIGFIWCYQLGHFTCLMGTHRPINLLRCFPLFFILSDVIIVLVFMYWLYLIVFVLSFVIFVCDWDT